MPQSMGANVSIAGLVVFGTFTSLAAKIVMFIGMTFCLPLAYYNDHMTAKAAATSASEDGTEPLLDGTNGDSPAPRTAGGNTWREVFMLSIPTFFDLIATVLMNVGLLSVTASVYQMLRGAEMLFAALFAVVFLKRTLNKYHYGGIACCIAGITLVGVSSLLSGEGSASHDVSPSRILFGMALIVASQAVQAAQITFEDFFMADLAVPPLKIVGYEGLFGSLTMICVLLPLVQHLPGVDGQGVHEDTIDTLHMITHSPVIARILALDMMALLAYNVAGMCVTGHLGAVFRTVLETTRTLFVWLVDLMLFYTPLGLGKLGESWNGYSWVQAAGFCILVAGTVIYGKGDEAEIAAEIAEGGFDAENGEDADRFGSATAPMAVGGGGRTTPLGMPMGVPQASSLKSSYNMNAFGSLPSSLRNSCQPVVPHCNKCKGANLGDLRTGDIILLLDGSKDSPYLFKAASSGGWARACISGFLVRQESAPGGLVLYHADEKISSADGATRRVSSMPLQDALLSGRFTKAVVRRLHNRLSPEKIALVEEFAELNLGRELPTEPAASVLMANTSPSNVATAYERMGCSEFVAMMLHLIGVVEPTDIPREFLAATPKGRVVGAPHQLRLSPSGRPLSPLSTTTIYSNSGSDDASPSSHSTGSVGTGPRTPQAASPRENTQHAEQPFGPPVAIRNNTHTAVVIAAS